MAGIRGRSKGKITARRTKTGNSFGKVSFDGFEDVRDLLSSLADRSEDIYERELSRAAEQIMSSAKHNVKSDTSLIVDSIHIRKYAGSKRVVYKIMAGGPLAPHAHLVEFGHRIINSGQLANLPGIGFRKLTNDVVIGDVPAHSFLRKAFDENKSKIEKALNDALDEILREV